MAYPEYLTKRQISHDEAREALDRFINTFWRREDGARLGIPTRPDRDDDFVLMAYIEQQRNGGAA